MIFGVCIGVSGIAMWLSFVKGGLARFVENINNTLILLSLVEKFRSNIIRQTDKRRFHLLGQPKGLVFIKKRLFILLTHQTTLII
jgi:hypothetical protein